jgi:hypothetical protein
LNESQKAKFLEDLKKRLPDARLNQTKPSRLERIMCANAYLDMHPELKYRSGTSQVSKLNYTDISIKISEEEIKSLALQDFNNGTPPRWKNEIYMAEYGRLYEESEKQNHGLD